MKPSDVRYLALQGGGGKGFAYIGAFEAFEGLGVLPSKQYAKGTVEGFSGASVGAIMALLLAIGCTSKQLIELFGSNAEFLKFFDGAETGFARGVFPGDWQARKSLKDRWVVKGMRSGREMATKLTRTLHELNSEVDNAFGQIGFSSTRMSGATLFGLWLALHPAGRWSEELLRDYPFLRPIARDPAAYVANLLYDRGLFPGFAVRDFLRSTVRRFIKKHPRWRNQIPDAADITFAELKDITGYDLVVVGTNLTQRRSVYFSASNTPSFLVVEAVGISACYPIMFKPIWIEARESDPILGGLRGYWVDGGLLNNIPLHAFDEQIPTPRKAGREKRAPIPILNPGVLGLALRPGAPLSQASRMPNDEEPLASFAVDLLETTLMPSGIGQYATDQERAQVIDIFSYSLSLFDFAPSEAAGRLPRRTAFDQVLTHFAIRS